MSPEHGTARTKRRTILVERNSQIYLSLLLLFYLTLYTMVMLAIILAPSILKFTSGDVAVEQQFEASREFLLMDQRVVPAVVVIMLMLAVHFLFVTNRIFGPVYRLKGMLTAWRKGRWPKHFSGRDKDFHQEFFHSFNLTVEHLRAGAETTRQRLLSLADELDAIPRDGLRREVSEGIDHARGVCRAAAESLAPGDEVEIQ